MGHGAEVRWDPGLSQQVDYEAELAAVIGRRARRVSVADALDYVLGYTCLNDVSARDIQFGDGQWVRGKSLERLPDGPVLVTSDEIPDPQALPISCSVNGELLQDGNTSQMYFGVAEIISYCSQSFSLEPGDVISTGTPSGVEVFRKPPRFLGAADVMVVEIEGIGRLENVCRFDDPGRPADATSQERFLVTGALGCIGAWTVRALVREGVPVVSYDLGGDRRRLAQIMTDDELAAVTFDAGDITDLDGVNGTMEEHGITNVIHLAALQVPFSRANPPLGAAVNVVGTVNLFEAVKRSRGPMAPLVYTSSIGAFSAADANPATHRLEETAQGHPTTHYGVYNKGKTRGRPASTPSTTALPASASTMTVYGAGRDQGLTPSPTTAIAAAVLGVPYTIAFGGPHRIEYAEDVAQRCLPRVGAGSMEPTCSISAGAPSTCRH